jgi:hypothetical protein
MGTRSCGTVVGYVPAPHSCCSFQGQPAIHHRPSSHSRHAAWLPVPATAVLGLYPSLWVEPSLFHQLHGAHGVTGTPAAFGVAAVERPERAAFASQRVAVAAMGSVLAAGSPSGAVQMLGRAVTPAVRRYASASSCRSAPFSPGRSAAFIFVSAWSAIALNNASCALRLASLTTSASLAGRPRPTSRTDVQEWLSEC